jgi:hypothetical protein
VEDVASCERWPPADDALASASTGSRQSLTFVIVELPGKLWGLARGPTAEINADSAVQSLWVDESARDDHELTGLMHDILRLSIERLPRKDLGRTWQIDRLKADVVDEVFGEIWTSHGTFSR